MFPIKTPIAEVEAITSSIYHFIFDHQWVMNRSLMVFSEIFDAKTGPGIVHTVQAIHGMYSDLEKPYELSWRGHNINVREAMEAVCSQGIQEDDSLVSAGKRMVSSIHKGDQDVYLLASCKDNPICIDHEVSHALYSLDQQYRHEVDILLKEFRGKDWYKTLLQSVSENYGEAVVLDEIVAYSVSDSGSRVTKDVRWSEPDRELIRACFSRAYERAVKE